MSRLSDPKTAAALRDFLLDRRRASFTIDGSRWHIQFNPKPVQGNDWDWFCDDYDGAADSGDNRCGTCATAADAIDAIADLNTSPLVGQPQGANFATCIRDALGLVLAVGIPVLLVTLFASYMGLFE